MVGQVGSSHAPVKHGFVQKFGQGFLLFADDSLSIKLVAAWKFAVEAGKRDSEGRRRLGGLKLERAVEFMAKVPRRTRGAEVRSFGVQAGAPEADSCFPDSTASLIPFAVVRDDSRDS